MPDSRQFDSRQFVNLDLPYDRVTKELDDRPRIVSGSDVYLNRAGNWARRPAFRRNDFNSTNLAAGERVDRIYFYQTVGASPRTYVLISVNNGTDWRVQYVRGSATPVGAMTNVPALRQSNSSEREHEAISFQGLFYIKGFPTSASGETIGTIIFDGSGTPASNFWGLARPADGPTSIAVTGTPAVTAYTVNWTWRYRYSFVSASGHVSSSSASEPPAIQQNRSPSETGPLASVTNTPLVTIPAPSGDNTNTTEVTNVNLWRTHDGGGALLRAQQVSNTGASQAIDDRTTAEATPDAKLNIFVPAPTTRSNDPPPTVAGQADQPFAAQPEASTNIVEFAGRLWYGIGSTLFFSGNEEIVTGVKPESWPGGVNGNSFIFKEKINFLAATRDALYVLMDNSTVWIRGFDRRSFAPRTLFAQLGGADFRQAWATAGDILFFLTHERQVALLRGQDVTIISKPLGNDITSVLDTAGANAECQFAFHISEGNAYLVVAAIDRGAFANTRVFVYDVLRGKWNPPWAIPVTAIASGRVLESTPERKLICAVEGTGVAPFLGELDFLDPAAVNDNLPDTGFTDFAVDLETNLFPVPLGGHLSPVRLPHHHSLLSHLVIERTAFSGDTTPTVEYRLDEFSGARTTATANAPPYIAQPSSYNIHWFPVQLAAQRAQIRISKAALAEQFELQTLSFVWEPEPGN